MSAPVFVAAMRGYAARQWRKRVAVGEGRKVGVAILPADVQAEVRKLEAALAMRHRELTAWRLPDGTINVEAVF